MAPFPLEAVLGNAGALTVYLIIGVGFGWVLEIAGFGNSRKLASQFYFKDMTVLKVMFTAIVTALVLVFAASGLGLLDFNRVWVPPTYLWPGIIGGLVMGVGFIIGGFCPGTSLVALATLKIDGLFYFLGATLGVFVFGETVDQYASFFHSSFMGRLTLPELFGLPTGWVVFLVVLMALFMFWGAEKLEGIFGDKEEKPRPASARPRFALAAGLLVVALFVMGVGQPTAMDRWEKMAPDRQPQLDGREVYIHPGELLGLMNNDQIILMMLDIRDEADFNLFHLQDAKRTAMEDLDGPLTLTLLTLPENSVIVLMSNNEEVATEAWKMLVAQHVINVYILEGGINNWLDVFGHEGHENCVVEDTDHDSKRLRHVFKAALGSNQPGAQPDAHLVEEMEFTPKVKIEKKKAVGGGCG
jgi:rhodanese-related sulfurtransferase